MDEVATRCKPKRRLGETFATRVSEAEGALIREAARRKEITPSKLIRRIVVGELAGDLRDELAS